MEDIIEKAWIELGKESIFYNYLKMYFDSIPSENVRIIKLSITKSGRFKILFNPKRLKAKGLIFTKAILKHEIFHIIHGHIFIKPKDNKDKKIWNLAMDAAINQQIKELDAFSVPLDVLLDEGCGTDNENLFVGPPMNYINKTAEDYYKWIIEYYEKSNKADIELIEDSRVDSHEDFANFEIMEEIVTDLVSEVISEAYEKSQGDIPTGLEIPISLLITNSKKNWKDLIRRFFGNSIIIEKYRTPLRPNRRYDNQPGWRSLLGPEIAIIIDTSGSIIEEEYSAFFSEIEKLAKIYDSRIYVVQIDNSVQNVLRYGKGDWKNIELKGKGSTDLEPAILYLEENIRPEGIIIFTDGYVDVPIVKRRVLFILSKKHNKKFKTSAEEIYGKNSIVVL
ncbi:Predicted metal-dependent peptidase [Marinitoga hydrogenitolerans DSM 16785]|uniref:Predicted metal-dependent peptidase n=1 Tax=Marinitoga hydrogenitolerans (strain DSM 16785 / JCM 12826 / AT1271) TaxID=1122195 RepID=A0A1M4VYY2_MARH1|nr:VWA-like domain-containing protein [Marinitoga hydrogenitolerans]SHE74254.1 Predicted metal-dependent peptidase [Marinitoga hydrogenitolerans DSM 16785]